MRFLSKAKKEIICALFNCACRGGTKFRPEFEDFLCDNHHKWAVKRVGKTDIEYLINELSIDT
jgi:hypothetical protein